MQLAYTIGVAEPVSLLVDTHTTAMVNETLLEAAVRELFDLTPRGVITTLDLWRSIYAQTAAYGHFGRELADFTWECTDRVAALREAVRRSR